MPGIFQLCCPLPEVGVRLGGDFDSVFCNAEEFRFTGSLELREVKLHTHSPLSGDYRFGAGGEVGWGRVGGKEEVEGTD